MSSDPKQPDNKPAVGSATPTPAAGANGPKIQMSQDQMFAFVAKGTPIPPEVAKWTMDQLKSYLKTFGIVREPTKQDYDALVAAAKTSAKGCIKDIILARGEPAVPAKQGVIRWLPQPKKPKDLVEKGKIFMEVFEPEAGKPGVNVLGKEAGAKQAPVQPMIKKMSEQFRRHPDGKIEALDNGQAKFSNGELIFSPTYEILVPSAKEYQQLDWPCSVHVKTDLHGDMHWKINGNLTVDGHWSASNIEVNGNAEASAGLQTNMIGCLKILGDFKCSYIQRTKAEIGGSLKAENSILVSDLHVKGDLECNGSPGAIMGSKIICGGAITANRVGSDRAVNTEIKVLKGAVGKKTTIAQLAAGTRMHVHDKKWIAQEEMPYESEA